MNLCQTSSVQAHSPTLQGSHFYVAFEAASARSTTLVERPLQPKRKDWRAWSHRKLWRHEELPVVSEHGGRACFCGVLYPSSSSFLACFAGDGDELFVGGAAMLRVASKLSATMSTSPRVVIGMLTRAAHLERVPVLAVWLVDVQAG